MPKVIDEAREKILQSAKCRLKEEGYLGLSLRNVAKDCSIAVGTIYNYFKNKDTLIAEIMLEDWKQALVQMDACCENAETVQEGIVKIYEAIEKFSKIYEEVWNQFLQAGGAADEVNSRHRMLCRQIELRLRKLLERTGYQKDTLSMRLMTELILAAVSQSDITTAELVAFVGRIYPTASI